MKKEFKKPEIEKSEFVVAARLCTSGGGTKPVITPPVFTPPKSGGHHGGGFGGGHHGGGHHGGH